MFKNVFTRFLLIIIMICSAYNLFIVTMFLALIDILVTFSSKKLLVRNFSYV